MFRTHRWKLVRKDSCCLQQSIFTRYGQTRIVYRRTNRRHNKSAIESLTIKVAKNNHSHLFHPFFVPANNLISPALGHTEWCIRKKEKTVRENASEPRLFLSLRLAGSYTVSCGISSLTLRTTRLYYSTVKTRFGCDVLHQLMKLYYKLRREELAQHMLCAYTNRECAWIPTIMHLYSLLRKRSPPREDDPKKKKILNT